MATMSYITPNMIDALSAADPKMLDLFLRPYMKGLKAQYTALGNPRAIYEVAARLVHQVGELRCSRHSFLHAELLAFMAEMLIAEGRDRDKLLTAIELLEESTEILFHVAPSNDATIKAHVSNALHLAVAQKALGVSYDALQGLQDVQQDLRTRFEASDIDMVMLSRQQTIMRQDARAYRKLAEGAAAYFRTKPMEYYGTVKRVFEFALNENMMDDAKVILPEFRRAYRAVRRKLPALSHVSFAKNVGQYLLYEGKTAAGTHALIASLRAAEQNHLYGQQRQIRSLLGSDAAGSVPKLRTFRVA